LLVFPDGSCKGLEKGIELNLNSNSLGKVSEQFGDRTGLKRLLLENNKVSKVSGAIFLETQLDTLSLQGNKITREELKDVIGWDKYLARKQKGFVESFGF